MSNQLTLQIGIHSMQHEKLKCLIIPLEENMLNETKRKSFE